MANKTPNANQTLERSCFIGKPLPELPYKEFEPTSNRIYDRFRGCGLRPLLARQPKGLSVNVVIWSLWPYRMPYACRMPSLNAQWPRCYFTERPVGLIHLIFV